MEDSSSLREVRLVWVSCIRTSSASRRAFVCSTCAVKTTSSASRVARMVLISSYIELATSEEDIEEGKGKVRGVLTRASAI